MCVYAACPAQWSRRFTVRISLQAPANYPPPPYDEARPGPGIPAANASWGSESSAPQRHSQRVELATSR